MRLSVALVECVDMAELDTNPREVSRDPLLPHRMTRADLALFWRVSPRTIERYEAAGIGPPPIRVGGRVLYRREDVLAWEQAQIDRSED